jgi:DNA-binding MarR family transcriptional regulator
MEESEMDHIGDAQPDLHQALLDASKKHSTLTVMFHQHVAKVLGLNITDHKCLDYVLGMEKVTAGQLADMTGLTTGAITSVLNRLEKAGFVRRVKDADDRRIVYVEPVYANLGPVFELFGRMAEDMLDLFARYRPEELSVILDYLERSNQVMARQTERLRDAWTTAGKHRGHDSGEER